MKGWKTRQLTSYKYSLHSHAPSCCFAEHSCELRNNTFKPEAFLQKASNLLESQAFLILSHAPLAMAVLYYVCLLQNSLFAIVLLLLAPLATSTLLNPSIQPVFNCFPPQLTPNKPRAHNCGAAIAGLPYSRLHRDYSLDPASGRINLNTALTSVGELSSDLHLPRTSWSGDCRIDVRLAPPTQVANLLWDDVRHAANDLVESCVGDTRIMPSSPGPGGGGSAQLGPVLVAIMYFPSAQPGPVGSRPGSNSEPSFRIGAYYPPGAQS